MTPAEHRLKIAFVVHDHNRHMGHSRYVAELAARFKRDHDVHVFANTFEDPDPTGITYHHVPALRSYTLASILSFVLPATVLVPRGFDVVHAQGLCGLRHDVVTAHFCTPAWYDALERAHGGLTWRQWLSRTLVTPLERLALTKRSTRKVIAISESIRADLGRYFGRVEGVPVIYHGVDLATFHPRNRAKYQGRVRSELGIGPGECMALFVGGLLKGAAAAIRAVSMVEGIRLVLISNSDPAADQAVARSEGVADRVDFLPFTKEVERYFAAADVFVFPTIYEPYGMVISEAMASGLPVVTSRVAGAAELIEHGRSGWLTADPWDPDQIADGLRILAADPDLRLRMGDAARSRIEAYTWDRAAAETLAVYREMIADECQPDRSGP